MVYSGYIYRNLIVLVRPFLLSKITLLVSLYYYTWRDYSYYSPLIEIYLGNLAWDFIIYVLVESYL